MPGHTSWVFQTTKGEKKLSVVDEAITRPRTHRIDRFLTAPGAFGSITMMLAEINTVEIAARKDRIPTVSKRPENSIARGMTVEKA